MVTLGGGRLIPLPLGGGNPVLPPLIPTGEGDLKAGGLELVEPYGTTPGPDLNTPAP